MKTIAIISQKGGVGKTTLAVHIATAAMLDGMEAAIVDLDQQASAEAWGDWREDEPPQVIAAKPATLGKQLDRIKAAGGELVVIDTPGSIDAAANEAVNVADMVLIPCRASGFDLHAIGQTAALLRASGKPGFVIFNGISPSARSIRPDALEISAKYGLHVATCWLAERATYRSSIEQGKCAQEYEAGGKAAQEVTALWAWIRDHVSVSA